MFIHCFNMDLESAINVYTISQNRAHKFVCKKLNTFATTNRNITH